MAEGLGTQLIVVRSGCDRLRALPQSAGGWAVAHMSTTWLYNINLTVLHTLRNDSPIEPLGPHPSLVPTYEGACHRWLFKGSSVIEGAPLNVSIRIH